jgi:hypothetical protein
MTARSHVPASGDQPLPGNPLSPPYAATSAVVTPAALHLNASPYVGAQPNVTPNPGPTDGIAVRESAGGVNTALALLRFNRWASASESLAASSSAGGVPAHAAGAAGGGGVMVPALPQPTGRPAPVPAYDANGFPALSQAALCDSMTTDIKAMQTAAESMQRCVAFEKVLYVETLALLRILNDTLEIEKMASSTYKLEMRPVELKRMIVGIVHHLEVSFVC